MANIPKVWNGSQFIELEAAATVAPGASTSVAGIVQLSDSTSTTSSVLAATPTAVKSAYDLAAAAIPKSTVTTAGDVIYATGSAAVTRLALGTAGQVLTVNSGATAPEWSTAASGGMTLIATATPSAATSLSFTSIPTTYKHLVIMWVDVQQSAAEYWNIRCNNDTTASYHLTSNNLGSITGTTFGDSQASFSMISTPANPAAYYRAAGSLTFWRYTDTSVKSMNGIRTYYASADQLSNAVSGRYLGTSAITRLDFIRTSTQTITGNFYLYGVS